MGVASGPVSFMSLYDASTDVVKQGGTRRGANMGILRVDHPDILEFIACKDDTTKITNFNISVAVTDAFMHAVETDGEYDLLHPGTCRPAGRLRARDVWERIINGAWKTGEPGVFFIDRANQYNPVPHLGAYEATNPCVVGSTRLATDRGLLTMDELHRQVMDIRVATDDRVPAIRTALAGGGVSTRTRLGTTLRHAVPVFKTRVNAPVFRLVTEHGYTITATDNHRFFAPDGLIELRDLRAGDPILLQSGEGAWSTDYALPTFEPTDKLKARVNRGKAHLPKEWSRELGQLLGWVIADGWTSEDTPDGRAVPNYTVGLLFGGDERPLVETFRARVRQWVALEGNLAERPGRLQLMYKSGLYYFLRSLGINAPGASKRVPESIWRAPREAVIGFLQAMFTADGTVNISAHSKTCSVRLAGSNQPLLEEVQLLLLNLGIVSKLRLRRAVHEKSLPDGHQGQKRYDCASQYELIIDKQNRDRFARTIGFISPAKQQKVERWISQKQRLSNRETFVTRIRSIEPAGAEDVYCTTEYETHSIVVNGCVTAQCGEQPLLPYDVCNLGSINLGAFARGGQLDWDGLRRVIHLSTHFLENVIDANQYPLPEIHELAQRIRRIGLGVMGLADVFVRLGVPYDSEDGVALGRKIQQFVDEEAKNESERLATLRGVFPEWERSIWGPDGSAARTPNGERIRPMRRLRNCNVTTVAPTGTISIIASCSSGIEPLFAVAFMRNQAGVLMPDVNEDFVAIAQREGWYSDDLMRRIAETGRIDMPEVPERWQRVFVTANHIKPEWHIRMQAAFQEYNDSAISKTCNFANDATVEYVEEIYRLAYKLGCKGVTVYRDGSRDAQVLSTGSTAKKVVEKVGGGGSDTADLHGELAELRLENERLRKSVLELEAENLQRRQKRSRPELLRGTTRRLETPLGTLYVTVTEDDRGQPFEVFMSLGKAGGALMADVEALGRLISLALRSGIPLKEIWRQLRGISSDRVIGLGPHKVLSVPDAVGIAIERWMQEKEGVQQELLPGVAPSSADAPVTVQSVTRGSEQMALGGMQGTLSGACPDCGSQLEFAEGCMKCHVCGFSECG